MYNYYASQVMWLDSVSLCKLSRLVVVIHNDLDAVLWVMAAAKQTSNALAASSSNYVEAVKCITNFSCHIHTMMPYIHDMN